MCAGDAGPSAVASSTNRAPTIQRDRCGLQKGVPCLSIIRQGEGRKVERTSSCWTSTWIYSSTGLHIHMYTGAYVYLLGTFITCQLCVFGKFLECFYKFSLNVQTCHHIRGADVYFS